MLALQYQCILLLLQPRLYVLRQMVTRQSVVRLFVLQSVKFSMTMLQAIVPQSVRVQTVEVLFAVLHSVVLR